MSVKPQTVVEYLKQIPEERKDAFNQLRQVILENIPKGFKEVISYGMIGFSVPHEIYPDGYHCDPTVPLPFLSIANQKNFIGFYHMGIYADEELSNWFVEEYKKRAKYKLDMGKSCIRLKRMDDIPFDLFGELVKKISVDDWIKMYESALKK